MAEAHSFTWHGTGQSLLEAKLRAINAAWSSVCRETFTFRDSDVGLRLRSALAAAARRGVRLRLAGKSDVRLMQLASRSLDRRLV